jgi:outer membrane protein assembly factor BamD
MLLFSTSYWEPSLSPANRLNLHLARLRPLVSIAATLLLAATVIGFGACSGKKAPKLQPTAQGDERLLALGRDALQQEKWEDARGYFQQLLDSYPRSTLAGDARLGVADSYFNQKGSGNLVLAIAEYRDFLTFFPNHPRADYAQFQIAYGHYKQIHSPDRDQDPTALAIEEFQKLIELYRNSRYAEQGKKLLDECNETMAESDFQVGLFYLQIRKHCRAAIARFNEVLAKYPTYSRNDELHFRLGTAYQLCRQPEEAKPHLQAVIDDYPNSAFREEAQSLLATLQADTHPEKH